MVIELLGDGGIRIIVPGREDAPASVAMARAWADAAVAGGTTLRITGDVGSPMGRAVIEQLGPSSRNAEITVSRTRPWPHGWTSLQVASSNGLDEIVKDLLARGAPITARRPDHSPYRLAMHRGHFAVMRTLRDAGARVPFGSQPPDELPEAVVARNYAPAFAWWIAGAVALPGLVAAIVLDPAFLIVAASGVVMLLIANAIIGRTRIAVDGPYISVRQLQRWQGPADLRALVALGYAPALSNRMSSDWRLIQRQAGPPYRLAAYKGVERELARQLLNDPQLRALTIYCGRDYLWPGLPRHLASYVLDSGAFVSVQASVVFTGLGLTRVAVDMPPED